MIENNDKIQKKKKQKLFFEEVSKDNVFTSMLNEFSLTFKDKLLESEFSLYYTRRTKKSTKLLYITLSFLLIITHTIISRTCEDYIVVVGGFLFYLFVVALFSLSQSVNDYYSEVMAVIITIVDLLLLVSTIWAPNCFLHILSLPISLCIVLSVTFRRAYPAIVIILCATLGRYIFSPLGETFATHLQPLRSYVFGYLGIICFSLVGGRRTEYYIRKMWYLTLVLEEGYELQRSLLNNILPSKVVDEWMRQKIFLDEENSITKASTNTVWEERNSISVIFCDLANFSKLVDLFPPMKLVNVLNKLFSCFDNLSDRHKVTKIETVADSYVAAAGIGMLIKHDPQDPHDNAVRILMLALDILHAVWTEFIFDCNNDSRLEVLIGINVGRIVAGIVGSKKPQFALFGDTVNTASRMKSTCSPRALQVTEEFYNLVKLPELPWIHRQGVSVKGKGLLNTHVLEYSQSLGDYVTDYYRDMEEDVVDRTVDTGSIESSNFDSRNKMNFLLKFDDAQMEKDFTNQVSNREESFLFLSFYVIYLGETFMILNATGKWSNSWYNKIIVERFLLLFFHTFSWIVKRNAHRIGILQRHSLIVSLFHLFFSILGFSTVMDQTLRRLMDHPMNDCFFEIFDKDTCLNQTCMVDAGDVANLIWWILFVNFISGFVFRCQLIINLLFLMFLGRLGNYCLNTTFLLICSLLVVVFVILIATYFREFEQRRIHLLNVHNWQVNKKTQELLYEMLPKHVVLQVSRSGCAHSLGFTYKNATLLLSDICGFTSFAKEKPPETVVAMLTSLFSYFDQMTTSLGVYKVCTIGDAYLAITEPSTGPTDPLAGKYYIFIYRKILFIYT
eukprot:GHVL01000491.1.p1 GENE.GHVL01000491.1~~GHVL01000491.1.p1  ORF type:complete len:844 (+),score=75.07 GHVL01000491.1:67-2598(+)